VPGQLILVPTPLGNLGDLTYRAVEALRDCDLVACEDTRRTGGLLAHLELDKPLQRFDDHAPQEAAVRVAQVLAAGRTVAYCSDAGMPGVNDPGFELARLAREGGAKVTVLPGPSAVTLAVVASGLPSHAFSFWGYLPSRGEPRRTFLRRLAGREETVVVFETPHRLHDTLADLAEIMPDREIALGRELTKLHETWYRGTPERVAEQLGGEHQGRDGAGAGGRRRQAHGHRRPRAVRGRGTAVLGGQLPGIGPGRGDDPARGGEAPGPAPGHGAQRGVPAGGGRPLTGVLGSSCRPVLAQRGAAGSALVTPGCGFRLGPG
jgi:16S rRNA (cytidine1402-2'-O)-methyltransferase